MRWCSGAEWADTPIWSAYRSKIEQGKPSPNATDLEDLARRYDRMDQLFQKIKTEGMSSSPEHLLRISIGRNGRLFWGPDGRHRVAIAKILKLPSIPARAGYVHPQAVKLLASMTRERP